MAATPEIFLLVQFQAKPGREADTERATLAFMDKGRRERNHMHVSLHRHPDDPSRFMLYELWTDARVFETEHKTSPHMAAFVEQLKELLVAPMDIQPWTLVRHDIGPAGGAE